MSESQYNESQSAERIARVASRHSASRSVGAAGATVVVAHGLWMPGWETWVLRRRLEAAGYRTAQFAYRTVGVGLEENAAQLARFAQQLPGERLHFVGHSLGGALILELFERHSIDRAGRIVCLGSPLKGSRAGQVLDANRWGRMIVGRCIHELLANGGCRWNGACDLGVVAGDLSVGFGRLLGGLASPNDGTVAVEETRLTGAADHIVLHCTHLSMLWSREVAEHVIRFLERGRFA